MLEFYLETPDYRLSFEGDMESVFLDDGLVCFINSVVEEYSLDEIISCIDPYEDMLITVDEVVEILAIADFILSKDLWKKYDYKAYDDDLPLPILLDLQSLCLKAIECNIGLISVKG